jgi:cobalt transporter subunit CbtB
MTAQTKTTQTIAINARERAIVAVTALTFGILLVFGAGFTNASALHNATHDVRHAAGFPCH